MRKNVRLVISTTLRNEKECRGGLVTSDTSHVKNSFVSEMALRHSVPMHREWAPVDL